MLELHERHAVMYRLTLDMVAWNEDRHPRNRRGKFQKKEAITTPDVAVNAMRQAILTHNDVLHAVYRADIGYVDFIWGTEGDAPSATGRRKGAKGIAHILEARVRKDGLTPRQAERVAEQIAKTVAVGKIEARSTVGDVSNIKVKHGKYTAVLVKNREEDAWLLSGFEGE